MLELLLELEHSPLEVLEEATTFCERSQSSRRRVEKKERRTYLLGQLIRRRRRVGSENQSVLTCETGILRRDARQSHSGIDAGHLRQRSVPDVLLLLLLDRVTRRIHQLVLEEEKFTKSIGKCFLVRFEITWE